MRDEGVAQVEETLDPEDWDSMRALGHRTIDPALDLRTELRVPSGFAILMLVALALVVLLSTATSLDPEMRVTRIILYILCVFVVYQILIRLLRKLVHFPAPAFIGRFLDSRLRRAMQPAAPLIRRSSIRPGMRVLEIGCGSGAYTPALALAVGSEGEVFALDIQPRMLEQLKRKLEREDLRVLDNVEPVMAGADRLPFADESLDAALMVTVLQEIPDKQRVLAEIRWVLRPGGILAVSEWLFDPDYPLKRVTVRDLASAGFCAIRAEGSIRTYTVSAANP